MQPVDYHIHTSLCNHASGAMEEYVRRAADAGLSEIAFLDHLTLRELDHDNSMSPAEVGLYHSAVMRLKKKYRGVITVRAGLEVDHDPQNEAAARRLAESFSFDLITCSVHFSDTHNFVSRRAAKKFAGVSDSEWADAYFDSLWKMIEDPWFDVVGHIDVFKKFGRKFAPGVLERFRPILRRMAETGLVMELNTSGLDHPAGETYPGPFLLEMAAAEGVMATLGSDAHAPGEVGRHFGEALKELENAGYRNLTLFERRRKRPVPIPAITGRPS